MESRWLRYLYIQLAKHHSAERSVRGFHLQHKTTTKIGESSAAELFHIYQHTVFVMSLEVIITTLTSLTAMPLLSLTYYLANVNVKQFYIHHRRILRIFFLWGAPVTNLFVKCHLNLHVDITLHYIAYREKRTRRSRTCYCITAAESTQNQAQ